MNFVQNTLKRLNFKPSLSAVILLLFGCGLYFGQDLLQPQYFTENGLMENLQLLVLAVAGIIAMQAKESRKLFVFAALVILFMMMRETNMLRGWVCSIIYNTEHACKWHDLGSYGYALRVVRALYVLFMVWYFIKNKLWQPLWQYAVKAPIYVWDLGIMFVAAFLATMAEADFWHNEIMEECFELVLYLSLIVCLRRYRRVKIQP